MRMNATYEVSWNTSDDIDSSSDDRHGPLYFSLLWFNFLLLVLIYVLYLIILIYREEQRDTGEEISSPDTGLQEPDLGTQV